MSPRLKPRSRPIGHDVVVTALLLLSCSERTEREVSRGDVARVEAPVKAHVESINLEVHETAGCEWHVSGGCRLHRCSERTATESRCTLVVERDRPARARARCAEGTTKLEVDPRGERFAVADDERWAIWAGGFSGELATTQPSVVLPRASGPVDWSAVPSAREIVRKELAWWLGYESRSMRNAALFENLRKLAPEHMGEDLVTLAADDRSIDPCARHTSFWGDVYAKQPAEVQAEVQAKLAPALVGPFDPAAPPPVKHAARVLHGKALLGAVGSPERYLERAGTSPVAAAAVLQAWSQTAPDPAASFACRALPKIGASELEDAAFAAIAHARLACPAALARKPRWCGELGRVYAPDDDQKDVKPDTVFCEPYEGFYFVQRLGNPSFDHQAFGRICRTGPDASEDDDERKNDD